MIDFLWTHPIETSIGITLLVLAGIWWALLGAPLVDESRCPYRATLPDGECGGPCRQGRLPCEEE